jgi:hypothetical protein
MGLATQFAIDQKNTLKGVSMRAGICVRDRNENGFASYTACNAQYDHDATKEHIETVLFGNVAAHFGDFTKIPQNAIIVLFSQWSPCIKCAGDKIPSICDFVTRIDARNRGIQVKCFFNEYYSSDCGAKSAHANGGHFIWKCWKDAATVYTKLQGHFGTITLPAKGPDKTKDRWVLSIRQGTDA